MDLASDDELEFAESKEKAEKKGPRVAPYGAKPKAKRGRPPSGARDQIQLRWFAVTWNITEGAQDAHTELFIKEGGDKVCKVLKEYDPLIKFWCALERTEREGVVEAKTIAAKWNYHYQIALELSDGKRTRQATLGKALQDLGLHGAHASESSTKGWNSHSTQLYSQKCLDPSYVDGVWTEKGKFKPQPPYHGEDLIEDPLPFQLRIVQCLGTEASDRAINWVANEAGDSGKSKIKKWLNYHLPGRVKSLDVADHKDMMQHFSGMVNFPEMVLINLPRADKGKICDNDMYNALESIKDGDLQTQKWQGKDALFKPPHVWVFANKEPSYSNWTPDRVRVWQIDEKTMDFTEESIKQNKLKDEAHAAKVNKYKSLVVKGAFDKELARLGAIKRSVSR